MKPTKETFLENVKDHKMEILNDSGIYRTIRFGEPDTYCRHFFLTTWDGHLTISGDMGTYTFERTHDMFKFFNGKYINPSYWSEKLRAGAHRHWEIAEEFDAEALKEIVFEEFNDYWSPSDIEEDLNLYSEGYEGYDDLVEKKEEMKEEMLECKEELQWTLDNINNIQQAYGELDNFECNGFKFHPDFFIDGFSPTKYTYHYLWCCYAIQWGIGVYNEYKEEITKEATDKLIKTCDEFVKEILGDKK